LPIFGTDYGIESASFRQLIRIVLAKDPAEVDGDTTAWSEMPPMLRRRLLQSEEWTPLDEKPAMVVIAEAAASDWTEGESQDDAAHDPEEEGYYI
jgi:hypothetical protein